MPPHACGDAYGPLAHGFTLKAKEDVHKLSKPIQQLTPLCFARPVCIIWLLSGFCQDFDYSHTPL
jgi:hypothetical protein